MKSKKILLVFMFFILIAKANGQLQNNITSFDLKASGLKIDFGVYDQKYLRLLSILPEAYNSGENPLPLNNQTGYEVFMHCTGENSSRHNGNPGMRLEFVGKEIKNLPGGKQVILVQRDPVKSLRIESFYEFNNASPVVRRYTKVVNEGKEDVGIEYLSSAMLYNYNDIPCKVEDYIRIHFAYNSWMQEAQWKTVKPSELGWDFDDHPNMSTISFSNMGSYSSGKYLPMGMIENTQSGLIWFWQIEHNGSWHWEM